MEGREGRRGKGANGAEEGKLKRYDVRRKDGRITDGRTGRMADD
jgi:hypothetical protein